MATTTHTAGFGAIPDQGRASSTLTITGLPGAITDLYLTLTGVDHTFAGDLDILLVGPDGTKLMVMSDIGGNADLEDATLILRDSADQALPAVAPVDGIIAPGPWRPLAQDNVETLADFGLTGSAINAATGNGFIGLNNIFDGRASSGSWTLIVRDDTAQDLGEIGDWALTLTTPGSTINLFGVQLQPVAIQVSATSATAGTYFLNGQTVTYSDVTGFNITGGLMGDLLIGGAGADTLEGLGGIDRLYGGAGNDILVVRPDSVSSPGEVLDGGTGTDTLAVRVGTASRLDLRQAILAGIERLELQASQNAVILTAAQLISLQSITSISHPLSAGDTVTVHMAAATTLNLGALTITGMGDAGDLFTLRGDGDAETITGSAGADSLLGRSGADVLAGGGGNDTLAGGNGADNLRGGAGADSLNGGAGTGDMLDYSGSATGVTVALHSFTASGGDAAGDTFAGIENITGSAADDVLSGDAGVNVLRGGAGNDGLYGGGSHDWLDGGAGNDALQGATGNDTFVFGAGYGRDRVLDFTDGQDRVDLVGTLTFAGLTETAIAGGVRLAITATPTTFIDLIGVTTAQVEAGDFV
jgi:Ca2+-binding RTX toxin-like protein